MANPHADTQLAKYISKRIDEMRGVKTQSEIATQAGFTNANMITMLKQGATKLAIDRVHDLSRALDADP